MALSSRFLSRIARASASPVTGSATWQAGGHSTSISTSRRLEIQRQSPIACSATARQSTAEVKATSRTLSRRAIVNNWVTSRSIRSSPRVTCPCASARNAGLPARCTTSHWIRSAASGVRSSCAASAVRRRSCSISRPARASSPFIAATSGLSSPGTSSGNGVLSSGRRLSRRSDSARTGLIAWRTASTSTRISTGKPISHGANWPSRYATTRSSRSPIRCPTATRVDPVASLR